MSKNQTLLSGQVATSTHNKAFFALFAFFAANGILKFSQRLWGETIVFPGYFCSETTPAVCRGVRPDQTTTGQREQSRQ